ncbi:MAG: rRNA pseudouridine synthase, partial [Thermoguttaceae bacterium]|nr:rRNA pseudouridine synthase [Thermoguttaceae bacterium]
MNIKSLKSRKSSITTSERRAAANSVFTTPDARAKANVRKRSSESGLEDQGRRLQQVLAAAGYGSRRQCEELILDGRVEVDGKIVTELGARVRVGEQKIRVDGEALPKVRPVYVALNKPKNALCTNNDPSGRRRVVDFIPEKFGRLFPVGRLDQNSEGLILLTNDGALAERLTHPRFEVPKKYRVQVAGLVDYELVDALKRGVHIAEGVVQADEVVIRAKHKMSSILEITLTEGKNREIRRMLARVGH